MIGKDIIFREVDPARIKIDARELSARLGGYCTACSGIADEYIADISECSSPRYAAVVCEVEYSDGEVIIAGVKIHSEALKKNLDGATRVVLMAVTLGVGVDTYIRRTSASSGMRGYMADAVASAFCEALCDLAEAEICRDCVRRPRFSPGYGDLPLGFQRTLLSRIGAESLLGITLTDSLLMVPTKSITAIIGIKNEKNITN